MSHLYLHSLCISLLLPFSNALMILDTTQSFASYYVPSPLFNRNIGSQLFSPIVGPIVFSENSQVCSIGKTELETFVRGKIVLLERKLDEFWNLGVAQQQTDCLAKAGALAVIKSDDVSLDPGMGARAFTKPGLDPEISIPLVHIGRHDINPVLSRIKLADDTILANITIDVNPWEELWESRQLFALWLIFLPLLNVVGLVLGLTAAFVLSLHHQQSEKNQKMSLAKRQLRCSNFRLLIAGNVFTSGTCFARMFYCFSGPLFSSTVHTMDFHLSLLDSTVVWEAIISIIAIVIFQNWTSFGMPKGQKRLNSCLGVLAGVAIPMYLSLQIIYDLRLTRDLLLMFVLRPLLLEAIAAIVAVSYTYRVIQFIRYSLATRAVATTTAAGSHRSHRRRIGTFMILAALASVVSVVAGLLALMPSVVVSVWWKFALYTIMFTGLTLQSLTQCVAFFPSLVITLDHAPNPKTKMTSLAQEIRDRRNCVREKLGANNNTSTASELSELRKAAQGRGSEISESSRGNLLTAAHAIVFV